MIDQARLTEDLKRLLDKELLPALRKRADREKALNTALREEHAAAKAARRTGQAFEMWREDTLTQVGVAWVLGSVFVRFMEDNGLVDAKDHFPRIAGTGPGKKYAEDQRTDYFRRHGTQLPLTGSVRRLECQRTLTVLVRLEARTGKGRRRRPPEAGPDEASAPNLQGHVAFCPADGGRSEGTGGAGPADGDAGAGGGVRPTGREAEIPPSARAAPCLSPSADGPPAAEHDRPGSNTNENR